MTKQTSKEVAIKRYDIDKPDQMSKMANVLKGHIVKNQLYTTIAQKNYAHVEGWQFAGGLLGLFPRVIRVENLSQKEEIKWMVEVDIVNKDGRVVSTGFALCSNKENKKKSFDEYAILSMAQTRAIGKAYRNMLGWVMKLAGYEGTPKEEMIKMGDRDPEPPKQPSPKVQVIKKDQVVGPDGNPTYMCEGCDAPIPDQVADYSKKVYGKRLCKDCQNTAKAKK